MLSKLKLYLNTQAPEKDQEKHMQDNLPMGKRKRMATDVAGSPMKKIQGEGNMTRSTDPCNNEQEEVSVRKRRANDDGKMPRKRSTCSFLTNSTKDSGVTVEERRIQKGKRRATVDARTSQEVKRCCINNTTDSGAVSEGNCLPRSGKRGRCSYTNNTERNGKSVENPQVVIEKRKASDNNEAPQKKMRCTDSPVLSGSVTSESNTTVSVNEVVDDERARDGGADISQNLSSVLTHEEKIYEMSSSANTSRTEYEEKYSRLTLIGEGGFGSVFGGFRKYDRLPVAIKYIPIKDVERKQVICNGKVFDIILEVALMLKSTGLSGPIGQSAAVSLLDWYILDKHLILVMERPNNSKDLSKYLQIHKGSLKECEAKMILRQMVDAAIDMHSKGVFHRDIKLHNVLVQSDWGVPRVRVIDFGCGSSSTEMSYFSYSGTTAYAPPEWFDYGTFWARPTSVWQLGALFYSLLGGGERFTTKGFINNHIRINPALPTDCKTLLGMCLARDPMERATLEELQVALARVST